MQSPSSNSRRLRTRAAAEYAGFGASTFEKFRVSGGGCPYIRIGRVVVYDTDDLDAWLASHRRSSTSDHPQKRSSERTPQHPSGKPPSKQRPNPDGYPGEVDPVAMSITTTPPAKDK